MTCIPIRYSTEPVAPRAATETWPPRGSTVADATRPASGAALAACSSGKTAALDNKNSIPNENTYRRTTCATTTKPTLATGTSSSSAIAGAGLTGEAAEKGARAERAGAAGPARAGSSSDAPVATRSAPTSPNIGVDNGQRTHFPC